MRNDFQDDDPKTIWQNQPTEASTVNLVLIRQKARELHARTRRQLWGTMTVPLIVAILYALCLRQFPGLQQVLHLLFAFLLAWSLAGLYFLNQGKWPAAIPPDAGFATGLEFCRREIQRQHDCFRRDLLWSFGPVLLAIATLVAALAIVAGTQIFAHAMPFMTLVFVWIVAYFVIRERRHRALQREIDELSDVERENGR